MHDVRLEFVLLFKDFGPLLELEYDKLLLLNVLEANEIDYLFHEYVRFILVHTLCYMGAVMYWLKKLLNFQVDCMI